ncbi:MAG: M48 family metalloprotease [Candidatus Thiodiazotropha sp. (ex. Lucinisca nassula)]|nr:M48 family metalloprotease [Candidatus Thiodiazotropha sp. (ex. Lucinisca nassula)]MBW9273436.1 M48 family metalloprotease [Candidatus Thiodiazotropha sp. (ex. Lucinisca nassula)]PUB81650.1 MAG: peptidase M48 [gamma proteobacterium symbiont of Ctena orbiculata]
MNRLLIPVALSLSLITGCAVNPVTGKKELSLVSEAQEMEIGRKNYAPLRQSQGGDYVVDKKLTAYVSEIGQKLAAVSDRKLPYEFKVLNNSVPNAWALPGGKISINRGLLTELGSEAELAAVLGHEITHAAAKHTASSMSRGMLIQGAVMATVIGTQGKDYAQIAQLGAGLGSQLITKKYGRDAERESDYYGMKYMSKAGYDPQGAIELQRTFVRLSEGKNQDWLSGLFASHPPSRERVDNNIKTAAKLPKGGIAGKDRFKTRTAHIKRTKPAYEAYEEGRKALQKGNLKKARTLVGKALRLEPKEGHFHALLGDIEEKRKHPAIAKQHYNKAIKLNDGFFYYYLKRGLVNEKLKNADAAKLDLERSIQLLPTANAYNSLGNLAQAAGNLKSAKSYYRKAASKDTTEGKAAYSALMALDLSENPQNYIKLRTGLDNKGRVKAELYNPTPRDVKSIVIAIHFRDANGQIRKLKRVYKPVLPSGKKRIIDLGVKNIPKAQLSKAKFGIIGARLAK